MIVGDLKRITDVFALNAVDSGGKLITFAQKKNDPVTAYYEGLHSGASRYDEAVIIDGLKDPIAVNGAVLIGVLGLLPPDMPLKLAVKSTTLQLTSKGLRTPLALSASAVPETLTNLVNEIPIAATARVKASEMFSRLSVLGDVSSKRMENMVLTGVHIGTPKSKRVLVLTATDLLRAAKASVRASIEGNLPPSTVVSMADLTCALGMIEEEAEILFAEEATVMVRDDAGTMIRLSTLMGQFPNLDILPRTFQHAMTYPSNVFSMVERACSIIDAGNKIVKLDIKKGKVVLSTKSSEHGEFSMAAGTMNEPVDFTTFLDGTYLSVISRLGDSPKMQFDANPRKTIRFEGDGIFYWLQPVAVQAPKPEEVEV